LTLKPNTEVNATLKLILEYKQTRVKNQHIVGD